MTLSSTTASAVVPAIRRIQWLTIAWMTVEVLVALCAAVMSHSVALAAFGGDSAIELFSAAVVLWRFHTARVQATATKITGWLLIALAVFISCQSLYTLFGKGPKPQPSYLGIALLLAAGLFMPWLGRRKRELAAAASSASLRADAAQSSVCAYMSSIALAGLVLNAFVHIPWADPLAALALLPIVLKEAKDALRGDPWRCYVNQRHGFRLADHTPVVCGIKMGFTLYRRSRKNVSSCRFLCDRG
jgi:divalent metal cation (Fe/Co/Zn/Cd) transporter